MQFAVFQHKCRRCGEIIEGPSCSVGHAEAQIEIIAATGRPLKMPGCERLYARDVHCCNADARGITDLIGYIVRTITE